MFDKENCSKEMGLSVEAFSNELKNIRTGRVSPDILKTVLVDSYGSKTPLTQLSNINNLDNMTLNVNVWDSSLIKIIEKSILDSNLGVTPNSDGANILLKFPELTAERRKELVKIISEIAEKFKISVRGIRRKYLDNIKKLEKDKLLSLDESKKYQDEVQKMTDISIKNIESLSDTKESEILKSIILHKQIDHVAFIMDGNNRWSKENNIGKYESYKKGANKLIEITNFIFTSYDINYVSAFALSKHNFKRGSVLINIIKNLLIDFLDPSNDLDKFRFRIQFKGNLNFLSKKIVDRLKDFEKKNHKSKKVLVIYLNYSGKDDILNSLKLLSKRKKFTNKNFGSYLSSAGIPDPDILIRSGGYKRISDFMLYQISFTELFFSNKLWPNINKYDVKKFIEKFNKIDRKFGN